MKGTIEAVVLAAGINGLGVVRSLAKGGIRSAVVFREKNTPAMHSRYAKVRRRLSVTADDADILTVLSEYSKFEPVLIACSDQWADFLIRQKSALVAIGMRTATPASEITEQLNDKAIEIEIMKRIGVKLPRSITTLTADANHIVSTLGNSIIIKPRSYIFAHHIGTKNVIIRDEQALATFLRAHCGHLDAFVAQEIVEGPDEDLWVCNCCFGESGKLLSAFIFQRIRTSPPHFGVTTFAVGRYNAEIIKACSQIGQSLQYYGPAMIEFKFNRLNSRFEYIETNPRIGMCNILDTTSGVNNVLATYHLARGNENLAIMPRQVDGVYYLNFYGDLYSRFEDKEPLKNILRSYWDTRGSKHAWAFFNAKDPMPWVHASLSQAAEIRKGLSRRIARAFTR